MIDLHTSIITALSTIQLPVHYEMSLHSGMEVPCLSYMELTNFIQRQSDISDINVVQFQIKVWANKISDIQAYVIEVDEVMRKEGWKRTSSAELYDVNSSMIQKVLTYEKLIAEDAANTNE